MSSGTMTTAEYAAHRGVSDSYIRRMRRQGKVVVAACGRRINVAASDSLLDDITDPIRGGDRTPGAVDVRGVVTARAASDVPSVQEAVRRERLAKAQLAELELGELTKALTRTRDVERATFTLVREALNAMMAIPSRTRGRLAAESEPKACEAILEKEIRLVAARMQRQAQKLAALRSGAAVEDGDTDAADLADEPEVDDEP